MCPPDCLSVLCCSVVILGAAAGNPCSIHTASERPSLILSLCSFSNMDRSGQSRRKPPPPAPISLCAVLYLTPVCPQHITTRAEQEGESPPLSLNTLLHSKRDKRNGGLLYQILVEASGHCSFLTYPVGNLFQTWSGALQQFSNTRRVNPSLSSTPPLLPFHFIKSFFRERLFQVCSSLHIPPCLAL